MENKITENFFFGKNLTIRLSEDDRAKMGQFVALNKSLFPMPKHDRVVSALAKSAIFDKLDLLGALAGVDTGSSCSSLLQDKTFRALARLMLQTNREFYQSIHQEIETNGNSQGQ